MATRSQKFVGIFCIVVCLMFGFVCSDFEADRKECSDQLKILAPCLPFVGGDAKSPSPACCLNLKVEVNTTKKCLCLIVMDRNNPNLGFKINATLALSLPSICRAPANVSRCPEILHLDPNSPDAQVFEQSSRSSNSTAATDSTSTSMALGENKWLEVRVLIVATALALIIHK